MAGPSSDLPENSTLNNPSSYLNVVQQVSHPCSSYLNVVHQVSLALRATGLGACAGPQKLLFASFKAECWLKPGADASQGECYRVKQGGAEKGVGKQEGRVALVLGEPHHQVLGLSTGFLYDVMSLSTGRQEGRVALVLGEPHQHEYCP
jgi:hypothetical protein